MARKYYNQNTNINITPLYVGSAQPLDVRMVVEEIADLNVRSLWNSTYVGMIVYVLEDSSLYVCYNKPKSGKVLDAIEDGWKKVDVDYSVRIVDAESNLTDGTTIMFPYQGMMAYVTSESALYVLLTKGAENAKDINNWKKISVSTTSTTTVDKIGIDAAPEGGYGFKITGNKGVIIDDYVNVENYIKANYCYTSKGVNYFEPNPYFTYDSVRLSKGGSSYIELYANGDNWIMINDPDNSLGLSVSVDGIDYVSGTLVAKETPICFGVDVKFNEGWTISFGDITRDFVDSDYELIDIYRSEYSPEVYAYHKDIDVRILTEDDLVVMDDKIDNLAHSIMIELEDMGDSDSSDSDVTEAVPLQKVIVNMNNAINKLEKVEPETIEHSEIDKLFL